MAKGKQEKKPPRVESEEEEDKYDLEFDKLSMEDIIKIKRLIEKKMKNKSCNLNNKKSISLARLKSSRLYMKSMRNSSTRIPP
jgi:predicted Zn-dependent protease